MKKITTFIAQGYTPPCVKIIEVKSQHVLCGSNSVDGIPTFGEGSGNVEDLGSVWE